MDTKIAKLSVIWALIMITAVVQVNAAEWSPLQIRHQEPTLVEGGKSLELVFSTPGINPNDVEDAFVYYRYDNEVSYSQKHASLLSSDFKTELQIASADDVTLLEYYFEIQLNNGEKVTYPSESDSREAIRVDIVAERESEDEEVLIDYTILSPDPESTVSLNDVMIAITLFYNEKEIDIENGSFQLLLDDVDVTEQAEVNDYFFTYTPGDIETGQHNVSLFYQNADTSFNVTSWDFTVQDPMQVTAAAPGSAGREYMPQGQVELSARSQQVGGYANDALSGNVRLSGRSGNISYSAHGLITTQEDRRLQPQNRFGAELYIGNWLDVQAGHVYPMLNSLTIAGQRMQGLNAGLHAFDRAVNLRVLYGKMRRQVSNLYDIVTPVYQEFGGAVVDTSYTLNFHENGVGNFERDLIGGRLSFGRGNNFQFGMNFLKVEDDTSSISVIRNFRDVMDDNPELAQHLSSDEQQTLASEPDLLSVNGNPRPQGNFVAASDIMFSLDNNRIQFQADAGVSLLSRDISNGPLTSERAEDMGLFLDQDSENLLNQLSWLIIINENMTTLPFKFEEDGSATNTEAFFPTSIVASQSEVGLNYLNNNLRIQYQWVGPDFNSLANRTIRRDVAGFSISDRVRFAQNRLFLTLGYESLQDNVINSKEATTDTDTYRSNISWYPIKTILPRVSVGFMYRTRENGVPLFNPEVPSSLEDAAVQNFMQQNGQLVTGPNARGLDTYQFSSSISQSFDLLGISHDANMNYSLLNTTDQFFRYGDIMSTNYSLNLVNNFNNMPLKTNIGFNINNTETSSGLTDITIYGINLGGTTFLLDDRLNLNVSVAFTKNQAETVPLDVNNNGTLDPFDDYYEPNTGNISDTGSNSFMVSGGALYSITENHAVRIDFRYNNITSTLRQGTLPNDQLLRARYIFNF